MAEPTGPSAAGIAADVAATGRNLSQHPNAVRWFSITAMLAIVLAFAYLVLRIENVPPGGMTVQQFTAAVAARDAAVKPSTDPAVALLTAAVETLRSEVASLRSDIKTADTSARENRAQIEAKIDRQATRTDEILALLAK